MGRPRKDPERGFDRVCETCSAPFTVKNTYLGRFCSHPCYAASLKRERVSLSDRFWARVVKGGGCWEWQGPVRENGYAQIWVRERQKQVKAHRVSWEIHFGPIPEGLWVCHRCDNRRCVRPDHLFLGTRTDNTDDMKNKGRADHGERRHTAKLTEAIVSQIRHRYARGTIARVLAAEFGVRIDSIYKVIHRQTWQHVP